MAPGVLGGGDSIEKGAGHPRRTALHGQNQESKRRHCTFEELTEVRNAYSWSQDPKLGRRQRLDLGRPQKPYIYIY